MLLRLIERTKVVLNELDQPNRDLLLDRILDIISNFEFIDFILPWISAWIDSNSSVECSLHQQSMINETMKILLTPKEGSKKLSVENIDEIRRILNSTSK